MLTVVYFDVLDAVGGWDGRSHCRTVVVARRKKELILKLLAVVAEAIVRLVIYLSFLLFLLVMVLLMLVYMKTKFKQNDMTNMITYEFHVAVALCSWLGDLLTWLAIS